MKRSILILLVFLAHSAVAQVASLEKFQQENQFRFYVEMEVRDFIYELDSEYSLMHQLLKRLRENVESAEMKKKIDVSISRVERARDAWRVEAKRMEGMKETHPNLKVIKFVLDLPEEQQARLKKQGYLLKSESNILEIIWDDGLAFYDGILGINHAEENLGANKTELSTPLAPSSLTP